MGNEAPVVVRPAPLTTVVRLAKSFPHATPVREPVPPIWSAGRASAPSEATIVEFPTARLLFSSILPRAFSATHRLQNSDVSLHAAAAAVAAPSQSDRSAAAGRWTRDVPNWIVKP